MKIKFIGNIWYWRGPAPFFFVTIPSKEYSLIKSISSEVSYGWGMIPVTAYINKTVWTTAMFPKDGSYILPIKAIVRNAEGLDEGNDVSVTIEVN